MSLSPPFDHFRDAVFPARLSARQEADGEQRYAWTEQRIDEEGKLTDADAPRSGTVEEDYAVGLNGVILGIPSEADEQPRVWLRLRGFHQESGRPVYEFQHAGDSGWWARLTTYATARGGLTRYWGWEEVEYDEDTGAWIELEDGRVVEVNPGILGDDDPIPADAAVCTSPDYAIAEGTLFGATVDIPMPVVWMTREAGGRPTFEFARIYAGSSIGVPLGGHVLRFSPHGAWGVGRTMYTQEGAVFGGGTPTLDPPFYGNIIVHANIASATNPGIVSTVTQAFAGNKTWYAASGTSVLHTYRVSDTVNSYKLEIEVDSYFGASLTGSGNAEAGLNSGTCSISFVGGDLSLSGELVEVNSTGNIDISADVIATVEAGDEGTLTLGTGDDGRIDLVLGTDSVLRVNSETGQSTTFAVLAPGDTTLVLTFTHGILTDVTVAGP